MKKLLLIILLINSINIFSQVILPEGKTMISEEELKERGFIMAIYPGGIDAFRQKFTQTFNSSNINSKGVIKSEAQFVISEEGTVSDIIISGDNKSMNKAMERAIKTLSKAKWKPAELDGKPIKFRFRLPITMEFH
ncbi:energy transducer TonB [Chryseobacterium sp. PBS4-4]|uniref:Energy transducer TonB n=1 Tax=Chryseobacterium edaphi TaxID=2976532 RepID=A0ABT2W5Y6_9FLAO|nr:energy transducer TonB [Chryseobacterium edaphi]MCU7617616.1 energy transducer TonB [Chryseobacterium edaphi]